MPWCKMTQSLCESCRDARSDHAQVTLLALRIVENRTSAYPKYPPQPVVRCEGYTQKKAIDDND